MIRFAFALLIACWLAGCGEREPAPAPGRPALWVVEGESGQPAGWLFGTIHALPDGAQWRTPALERAIAQAGMLVVEVRDLDPAAVGRVFDRLARDRPGPPLAARLPPGPRRELAALLAREGKASATYDALETWAAALAVARLGDDARSRNGADRTLVAEFARRPVQELESAADQLAIFDRLPERDQRALLAAVIAEQSRAETDDRALERAWLAGDTASMERLARTGMLADPALYEVLLAQRDRAWAAQIAPLLREGRRPLVAVGTAHMLGPDGLPALLTAQGYRVRRLQ